MSTSTRSVALAVTLSLLFCSQRTFGNEPLKWDYKVFPSIESTDAEELQSELGALGSQGWELSGIIARRSNDGADLLLFKRPRQTASTSPVEATVTLGSPGNLQKLKGDFGTVSIDFVEETGLVTIRGSKPDVARTLGVIEAIKAQAEPKPQR